jgi:hypothetical protein
MLNRLPVILLQHLDIQTYPDTKPEDFNASSTSSADDTCGRLTPGCVNVVVALITTTTTTTTTTMEITLTR